MSKAGDLILIMYESERALKRITELVEAVFINADQGNVAAASEIAAHVIEDVTRVANALREHNEKFVAERDKQSGMLPRTLAPPMRSRPG
jgi:DNA-binding ferritin-like protein